MDTTRTSQNEYPDPLSGAGRHTGGGAESSAPPADAPSPLSVRARVSITPWTDVDFANAVREIARQVTLSPEVIMGTGAGAVLAERLLRARGYQSARVVDERSVDEAMRHVARWRVLRDG